MSNPLPEVSPLPVQEALRAPRSEEISTAMTLINLASMPFRAADAAVGAACNSTDTTREVCKVAADGIQALINLAPESVKSTVSKAFLHNENLPAQFKELYGIDEEDTAYFVKSIHHITVGAATMLVGGGISKFATGAVKSTQAFVRKAPPVVQRSIPLKTQGNCEAEFNFYFQNKVNQPLHVYVEYLGFSNSSYLVEHNATSGITYQAIKTLKQLAKEQNTKELLIQWAPANQRLVDVFGRMWKFQGRKPDFFIEPALSLPVFKMEVPLKPSPFRWTPKLVPAAALPIGAIPNAVAPIDSDGIDFVCREYKDFLLVQESPLIPKQLILGHSNRQNSLPKELDPTPEVSEQFLEHIGQELLSFTGQISGVTPALEELTQVKNLVETLLKNPADGSIEIVAHLFKTPQAMVRNVLQQPEAVLRNCQNFINNPAANFMGALSAVSGILTFMDSVSWIIDFAKSPKKTALSIVKMPYTTVEGVIKLGSALIKHPEKAAGQLFKSLVKAPAVTVKRFLTSVGLKKKRKHRRQEPVQVLIDPAEQMRIAQQYAHDLIALYSLARSKWMLDPYKTAEDYHHDLLADWNCSAVSQQGGNYYDFPRFLTAKFEQNDLQAIRQYSPFAHYFEPIPPPEVIMQTLLETQQVMAKVEVASAALAVTHAVDVQATEKLNIERERLRANTGNLSALLANPDELKQRLLAKMNK